MKKRVLRSWVRNLLYLIIGGGVLLLGSECESTILFIISKGVALGMVLLSAKVLLTYE